MRVIAVFLFLAAASCCAQFSWKLFFTEEMPTLVSPPAVSDVSIAKDRVAARIYNSGAKPLYYLGYLATKPVYYYEEEISGVWKEGSFSSCGTGLSEYVLGPGEFRVVEFPPPGAGKFRLYTAVSEMKQGRASLLPIVVNE